MIDHHVDLFPVRIEILGSRILAGLAIFFGASFVFLPLAGLMVAVAEEGWSNDFTAAFLWFLLPFALFLALLLWGVNQLLYRLIILVDDNHVRWSQRTLRGTSETVEPLAHFMGIQSVKRSDSDDGTLYELRLLHPEAAKTVLLYQADSPDGCIDRWKQYCRRIGVKPIEYVAPGEYFTRDSEDLGCSLISLIRDGKLTVADPGPPPRHLQVERSAAQTVISLDNKMLLSLGRDELQLGSYGNLSISFDSVDTITIEPSRSHSGRFRLMLAFRQSLPARMKGPEEFAHSLPLTEDQPLELLVWIQRFLLRLLAGV